MDIRPYRLLMELQSLNTLGAVRSFAENSGMFAGLLASMQDSAPASGSRPPSFTYSGFPGTGLSPAPRMNRPEQAAEGGNGPFSAEITKAAQTYNIPEKLIRSVIRQESGFDPGARSPAGASGLMQLMPGTARFLGVQDPFDPADNIMGGTKYLRQLLDQFDQDLETALAAYNAGPGNVRKYGGIPPFNETRNYVEKVLGHYLA
ncbi:lytic transglycosylase domain-containing protein [Indiicoccus explosivorum]|uniref:lytic transglycosylase domain-containing protein n=1 Tax=Indiicoccus explosivorum TaxID=1917864 RepID=UPI001F4E8FF8|nr:lytic transglycosylase domain-containing protein [Indiicoccus explosivorum]